MTYEENRALKALLLAVLLLCGAILFISNGVQSRTQERLDAANDGNTALMAQVAELEQDKQRLRAQIVDLTEELRSAYGALQETRHENNDAAWPAEKGAWNTIPDCVVTAYCPCEACCGKWTGGPTSTGKTPAEGVTVAVDPNVIPLGAEVIVEGVPTVYLAQDTGTKGNHIDLFFGDHEEALQWGRQVRTIYWRAAE